MNNWKECFLSDLLTIQRGHDLTQTEFKAGPYVVAGSNGPIGFHNSYTAEGPGITIGRSGNSIGVTHYYEKNFWAHNTTLYSKEFKNANPKFIYYLFRIIDFKSLNSGSAVPSLNRNHLYQIKLSVPSIQEQQSIAEVLSSLDDKIKLLHRQNKTLEQMAETLFRQWFVESKEEITIKEEFNVTMGQSPPGDSYNEIKEGILFFQGRTDFGFRFPEPRIYCTSPTRYADKLDTLMSVRAPVGDLNYAEEKCCIGRGLAAIRHKNKYLHHSYAYYTLKYLKSDFDIHEDSGTIFGSINKDELLNIKCPKIEESRIHIYNSEIGILDDKIVLNCKQIKTLENLRNSLLPKFMNGSIRVINN